MTKTIVYNIVFLLKNCCACNVAIKTVNLSERRKKEIRDMEKKEGKKEEKKKSNIIVSKNR